MHSENHWNNEEKAIKHLQEIIFPYLKKKKELCLPEGQKVLLIYDLFKGQKTDRVLKILEDNHCVGVYVVANMTHIFHVLDKSWIYQSMEMQSNFSTKSSLIGILNR